MMQGITEKRQPIRRCTACSQHFPKKELVRVVRTPDGEICIDFTGKKSGRGAYICKKSECFKKAKRAKRLDAALDCTVPDEVYEKLAQELSLGK